MKGNGILAFLLLIVFLFIFHSLKAYTQAEYTGTWELSNTITKITLQLNTDNYILMKSVKTETEYVDVEGIRGSLIIEGNRFLAKILEIYLSLNGTAHKWYTYFRQPYIYGKININGDTLIWLIDFTKDGDYDDLYEQVTLIRQL